MVALEVWDMLVLPFFLDFRVQQVVGIERKAVEVSLCGVHDHVRRVVVEVVIHQRQLAMKAGSTAEVVASSRAAPARAISTVRANAIRVQMKRIQTGLTLRASAKAAAPLSPTILK